MTPAERDDDVRFTIDRLVPYDIDDDQRAAIIDLLWPMGRWAELGPPTPK